MRPGLTAEATELLAALVACPSPSGSEEAVQRLMADWLRRNGVSAEIRYTPEGLANLVAQVPGNGPGPHLLLLGHADTVEPVAGWTREPFGAEVEGDRLYGVGAMDMKAGLVAAMLTMRELAHRSDWAGTVTFASVADEENASRGALAFLRDSPRFDAALVCEPHFDAPTLGAVGKVNLRITCRGVSAHGSRPEEGVNAIDELARLLARLGELPPSEHPLVGRGSRCVLRIEGGLGPYQIRVPDEASCLVNWHLVPGETAQEVVGSVEALAAELRSPAAFEVEPLPPHYPSYLTERDAPFVQQFEAVYETVIGRAPRFAYGRGVSDANYTAELGIPTIMFGPSGANLHAADEWTDTTQIARAAELYLTLVAEGGYEREENR